MIGYVCGLGEIQRNAVYEGVRVIYENRGFPRPARADDWPTMDDLAAAVGSAEATGRRRNVVARLRPLSDFGLVADPAEGRGFTDLLREGAVIDVHGPMEQVQRAAGAFVLRKVYREMFRWGQTKQLRLAVVLDEAHRLAGDITLPKIMKKVASTASPSWSRARAWRTSTPTCSAMPAPRSPSAATSPQSRKVAGFLRGRSRQDMLEALEQLSVARRTYRPWIPL